MSVISFFIPFFFYCENLPKKSHFLLNHSMSYPRVSEVVGKREVKINLMRSKNMRILEVLY